MLGRRSKVRPSYPTALPPPSRPHSFHTRDYRPFSPFARDKLHSEDDLGECLADQPVEARRHRSVDGRVFAQEVEVGRPFLGAVGEIGGAGLDEALERQVVMLAARRGRCGLGRRRRCLRRWPLLLRNHCDTCLERTLAAPLDPEEPGEVDSTHDSTVFAPQAGFPLTPP
jgi:hypothetical protein